MTEEETFLGRMGSRLSRHDIEAECCEEQLAGWYREHTNRIDELLAYIEAWRDTGTASDDWLRRAGGQLGHCRLVCRWIEARMLALRFTPPYSPKDPRCRTIRAMEGSIERLKKALRQAGLPLPGEVRAG